MDLKRGFVFTHERFLDTSWKPGPGQRYTDAPKQECVVTRVTQRLVYYQFSVAGKPVGGKHVMDRSTFVAKYSRQSDRELILDSIAEARKLASEGSVTATHELHNLNLQLAKFDAGEYA